VSFVLEAHGQLMHAKKSNATAHSTAGGHI